jgi:endonuclease/exonuclease/phosphatase (EEP) superfamily protein YafD
VRSFGLESGYPLVPLIAYTPFVALVALLVAICCALLRRWSATVVAGLAALALLVAVAPRVLGGDYEGSDGLPLTVMTANVFKGQGDPEQLLSLVREHEVDVLAVQELTPKFVVGFRTAGIRQVMPHEALATRESVGGSGLYSRHDLSPGGSGDDEFLQMSADVEYPVPLSVVSVHPVPPTSRSAVRSWESVLDRFGDLPPDEEDFGAVRLLLGDFNATLDQGAFRDLLDRGYVDAGEETGGGLAATWPAFDKSFGYLPVTIDHLLAERDNVLGVRDYEVLELEGSDHRPVVATLVLSPSSP